MANRSRGWFITVNNELEATQKKLEAEATRYTLIGARETAPTTGHEHYHAYLLFDSAKNFKTLEKRYKGVGDIQPAKGTYEQVKGYCCKDGEPVYESGEPPHQGALSVDAKKLKQMTRTEIVSSSSYLHAEKIIRCRDILNSKIGRDELNKKAIKVIYISGPSGYGKSQLALELIKNAFDENEAYDGYEPITHKNGFWIGVSDGTGIAFYDEFRDNDLTPSDFIKLIDYNPHILNIKGGSIINRYSLIIITSVFSPLDLWKSCREREETSTQWLRRINQWYCFDKPNHAKDKTCHLLG